MDFCRIRHRRVSSKGKTIEVYPSFLVRKSEDLMVRGGAFYAIWDEERKMWSTDEYDVQRLVDNELRIYAEGLRKDPTPLMAIDDENTTIAEFSKNIVVRYMDDLDNNSWSKFRYYTRNVSDNFHPLDENLVFSNQEVTRSDYASKRLTYPLAEGSIEAYDEIMSILYAPDQRHKIEWAIGSIVAGDGKHIQKFAVLYGPPGSGKSTVLNIIQMLFDGYYSMFDARALGSSSNAFSTEVFKNNPLVAIQHDGDLSKIEDNTKLNSIVSHEEMVVNEKFKASYVMRLGCFLFMGTNKAVKITDAYAGILRRLIDIHPSGVLIPNARYHTLMTQIGFELGAIAHYCLSVYRKSGKNYYSAYRPMEMMYKTDPFFNFVEDEKTVDLINSDPLVTLGQMFERYKRYCEDANIDYPLKKHQFREELKAYFETFHPMTRKNGKQTRSCYSGFKISMFTPQQLGIEDAPPSLTLESTISVLDTALTLCPAQYASEDWIPVMAWDNVITTLSDIDTSKLHYVRPPQEYIVVDFDLKDEHGKKSLELNLEAASGFPPTYGELSKSGSGVHLWYEWDGDVERLSRIYDDGIEVKVFTGKSAIRRKLTRCNTLPIAKINTGLPLKGEKKVVNFDLNMSERKIRTMILRNLGKQYHTATKPSIDFIHKILTDAYNSKIPYDVTDLRQKVLVFATNSTNQSEECIKVVNRMHFKSEEPSEDLANYDNDELVFYDVEVFKNYFIVVWKVAGGNHVIMVNPSAIEIEALLRMKLVGFNCRRYDNHILYAAWQGYTPYQLWELSQRIISGSKNASIGEAYNASYADVYDFSTTKQGLKKWEVQLRIPHKEMKVDWNEELPEDMLQDVIRYCCNDVDATETTFNHNKSDFVARQIIADLSGLKVNDTTQAHASRFLFGRDQRPYDKFNYVDLSELFPGYTFDAGKSYYRDELVGEGGYVYAEPGSHENVAVLDVVSMHPWSLRNMNMFGPYQEKFNDLLDARVAIKHKDIDRARILMGGVLAPYIDDPTVDLDALAYALKIVINSVYGFTAAKFENKFKDPRNKDNIVAKRGALFMIDLKHAVQEQGFTVAHIKTDSIKIPNATEEIINFVHEFGKKYGYEFEHENTYDRFCLVNDAVYIARDANPAVRCKKKGCWHRFETTESSGLCPECGKPWTKWTATGKQFAVPYVFKSLFSHQPIEFDDLCEEKSVTTAMYLKFEDNEPHFVGKVGLFCPIQEDREGCTLLREGADGKFSAVTGTKGFKWLEADTVQTLGKEDHIDHEYYHKLVDAAKSSVSKHCDFDWFVSDTGEETTVVEPEIDNNQPPWNTPCGREEQCAGCKQNGCSPDCMNKPHHTLIHECITPNS